MLLLLLALGTGVVDQVERDVLDVAGELGGAALQFDHGVGVVGRLALEVGEPLLERWPRDTTSTSRSPTRPET